MVVSPELLSLLQGCKDAPDDDVPRMILADWLDDHGEAERAEFVRLSVRLEAGDIDTGDEAPALARLHELYSRNSARWLGDLAQHEGEFCFRRGLLEARATTDSLAPLLASAPPHVIPWLETLSLDFTQQKYVEELLGRDELALFSALELTDSGLSPEMLTRLGNCSGLGHTRRMRVKLGTAATAKSTGAALAGWKLGGLRVLDLQQLSQVSLKTLLSAPWVSQLSALGCDYLWRAATVLTGFPSAPWPARLFLETHQLSQRRRREIFSSPAVGETSVLFLQGELDDAIEALAGRGWPRLRRLVLLDRMSERCAETLARADGLGALRRLSVTPVTDRALSLLLSAKWFGGIRHLEITSGSRVQLSGDLEQLRTLRVGSMKLADLDRLPSLTALSFSGGQTVADIRTLADSPLAAQLRHLELSEGGDDLIVALAVPAFAGLTSLGLGCMEIGADGVEFLARGPWRGLLRLRVDGCDLDEGAIAALLRPDALPRLTVLDARLNGIPEGSAKALLEGPLPPRLAQLSVVWNSRGVTPRWPLERPAAFPRQE